MAKPAYRLYWEALTGAMAPQAMLEELAIPYEKIAVDMESAAHKQPDYLAINPAGQVPALELPDGTVMAESAAMVLVLGDTHPGSGLVPRIDEPDRPVFLHWLLFMATNIYTAYLRLNHPERYAEDSKCQESVYRAARTELDGHFGLLERRIAGDPYFLPRGFTALDLYLSMFVTWHPERDRLLSSLPRVAALYAAVEKRESFSRVLAEHEA